MGKIAGIFLLFTLFYSPLQAKGGKSPSSSIFKIKIKAFASKEEKKRRKAVRFMIQHRFSAFPYAVKALSSKDWRMRYSALEVLSKIGPLAVRAVPEVLLRLEDSHWRVRLKAHGVLAELANQRWRLWRTNDDLTPYNKAEESFLKRQNRSNIERAISRLISALEHPKWYIRECAVEALGYMGKLAKKAIPALLSALKRKYGSQRTVGERIQYLALEALKNIGYFPPNLIQSLVEYIGFPDEREDYLPAYKMRAAKLLGKIGVPAIAHIFAFLRNPYKINYPSECSYALAQVGEKALPYIIANLKDNRLQQVMIEALGQMGKHGRRAKPYLWELLDTNISDQSRLNLLFTLLEVGESPKKILPRLVLLLYSSSAFLRAKALEFMGKLGPFAQKYAPHLFGRLKDCPKVKIQAIQALLKIGLPSSKLVEAFVKLLKNPKEDRKVQEKAIRGLASLGPKAMPAFDILVQKLSQQDWLVGGKSASVFGGQGSLKAFRYWGVVGESARALGNLGSSKAIPYLIKTYPKKGGTLQSHYRESLEKLSSKRLSYFEHLGKSTSDPSLLALCIYILRGRGKYLPIFLRGLKQQDRRARRAAYIALKLLGKKSAPALPLLKSHFLEKNPDFASVTPLLFMGKKAHPFLKQVLGGSNRDQKLNILWAIGEDCPPIAQVMALLKIAFQDKDEDIRTEAHQALDQLRHPEQYAYLYRGSAPAPLPPTEKSILVDVFPLIRNLDSPDRKKVDHSLGELEDLGAWAVPAVASLIKLLKKATTPSRQKKIIRVLATIGPEARDALPLIAKHLIDKNMELRIEAVKAVGKMRAFGAPLLKEIALGLYSKNEELQGASADALCDMGPLALPATKDILKQHSLSDFSSYFFHKMGRTALPYLERALKDKKLYPEALYALAKMGEGGMILLVKEYKKAKTKKRKTQIFRALLSGDESESFRSPAILPLVVDGLKSPELRQMACELATDYLAPEKLSQLTKAMEKSSQKTRKKLAEILVGMENLDYLEALPEIMGLFENSDDSVRVVFGELYGQEDVSAYFVKELQKVWPLSPLKSKASFKKRSSHLKAILELLPGFEERAKGTLPYLVQILNSKKAKFLWPKVIEVIFSMGPSAFSAIPSLLALAKSHPSFQEKVNSILQFMDYRATPVLISALGDPRIKIPSMAKNSLVYIGSSALPLLIKKLATKDPKLRRSVIQTLAKMGNLAVPRLILALKSPKWRLRAYGARALGKIKPSFPSPFSALCRLARDPHYFVRFCAIWALGDLGKKTEPVLASLYYALGDSNKNVKLAAREALKKLGAD